MERIELLNNHFVEAAPTASSSTTPLLEHYDYIIVGAGSSGCVIAARLSEDPTVSVLLLEAGAEDDVFTINTPVTYGDLQMTDVDWQFKSEKQPHQNNRVSAWPRGKVMGGCSSINAMLYVRGDKENYDSWERDGCTGWGFKDVLPYFKKSETCMVEGTDPEYRGKKGDWKITSPPHNEYADHWVKAGVEAGIPFNKDYNGSSMHGISLSQVNIHQGVRQNTSKAFLSQHRKNRKNLTIVTLAQVTRVIFQGNTAIGVQLKRGSVKQEELSKKKTEVVFCNKEVILSGGAVNSPWILLSSGVGPKKELEELGIPVVADLPVGKNLQDHLMVFYGFQTKNGSPIPGKENFLKTLAILSEYLLFKTGVAAHTVLQGTAFLTTGLRKDDSPAPDLQIHFVPAAPSTATSVQANLDSPYWKEPEKNITSEAVIFLPTLLRPKSVGEIRLTSKDPLAYPSIQPNYFSDPEGYDLKLMVEGMKWCRKMVKQPSLANKIRGEVYDTSIPHPPESDEYLAEFLRRSAITVYHPVGTCKMGALSDATSVVDPTLKVKGIKGLRVADASIMPNIVSANTNAPAVMIGEKAADLIKADQKRK